MKRVIFIEPIIENGELIEFLFNKYNPDSSFVKPHICLVFPFESNVTKDEINNIFERILSKYNDFNICLHGTSISYEGDNNFLFLNIDDQNNILKEISEELYGQLGPNAKLKGEYTPHITIGKSKSVQEIELINSVVSNVLTSSFNARIESIYSKILLKDDNGNIFLENEIEYNFIKEQNKLF